MNKPVIIGVVIAGIGVLAGLGIASRGGFATSNDVQFAQVVGVKPVKETTTHPRQVCHDEVVTHAKPVKDEHQIAGTAIGAIAGGLLGNQVGGGKGKTLATVAGAAAGGYAGHEIQKRHQENATYTTTETRCKTVNDKTENTVGYDVEYDYNGVTRHARMDHDPGVGSKLEVDKEGTLATANAGTGNG
ncbi:MAG: glycine zipper 2TM domain-containing protein [Mizugakiibacter sp.]|uniref:glycine zipper 2TM domain-containing protein n=1 Tax=Mizugakiibacter sp. TaxID=1972610 RepID=UPI0031BC4E7E|nr:glycine zipper 2TM domain-containing protein [Xanthomonadaceae bacterium]